MKKWRFISNQNSTIVGINDAGIETFTANMNRSLVREIIQNSLDAALPDLNEPVKVDFAYFDMSREKVPDVDNFQDVLQKCMKSNSGEPDAYKFFKEADDLLKRPTIKVLRISDHNTIGLEGSNSCKKGTSWSRLVKESGSSNKGQNSGGSFGIGKSAAFACSDFRTVFYSSRDHKGLESNFGVAKLVSFQDEAYGGWTTGIGYYSEDSQFVAIPELANFDPKYSRVDSGTDIYIMGMHMTDDFENVFIRSVLLDFLVSFVEKKLVVNIQGRIINHENLSEYMSKLNPYDSEEIRNLLEYYDLLTSSNPKIKKIPLDPTVYGKKYGFEAGECILYLKEGEKLNRKILITREAGMRILEQNRISGSIEFTGVLIINGSHMNEVFKKMEVPSHDAWEPGRCRGEEKKYSKILSELRKYLRDTVKECYGKVTTSSMDAIGASDFLPDSIKSEEEKNLKRNTLNTQVKKLVSKEIEPTKKKTKPVDVKIISMDGDENSGSGPGDSEGPTPGPGPHPGPGLGPEPGENSGLNPGDNPGPSGKDPGDNVNYKLMNVKKRVICSHVEKGLYLLNFIIPSTASKGKIEFTLSGEQNDFELPIMNAKVLSGKTTRIESIIKNTIFLNDLKKGERLKIQLTVDFDTYCMMEVDYYANKK